MEVKNAIIKRVWLGIDDHGFLSSWVSLDYGGVCQGFGGWDLRTKYASRFIRRVLEISDVLDWDKLVGKTVRVKADHSQIYAIGHIVKEDWFEPKKEFSVD